MTAKDRDFAQQLDPATYESLWRYCWRLCCNRDDAEDLLQTSLAHALIRYPKLRRTESLRAWLIAIARTQYLQHRRRRGVNQIGEQLELAEVQDSPASAVVQECIKQLPAFQRELLELYYFDGLSLSETAAVLRIKPNTLKQRLLRARAAFKRQLETRLSPGELAAIL